MKHEAIYASAGVSVGVGAGILASTIVPWWTGIPAIIAGIALAMLTERRAHAAGEQ